MSAVARRVPATPPIDLADAVAELTRPHTHRERFTRDTRGHRNRTRSRYHITQVPALLDQLESASPSGKGDDRNSAGYESRPAARVDSLDALITIDRDVTAWLRTLDLDPTGPTRTKIRRLYAHALQVPPTDRTRRAIDRDLRAWHTQARIITGWDTPAWRPTNTCPLCAQTGTLRIRWTDQLALCTDCLETWDETTIGLLADHIRTESDQTRTRPQIDPCYCPIPQPTPPSPWRLCGRCGSARCAHALHPDTPKGPDHG